MDEEEQAKKKEEPKEPVKNLKDGVPTELEKKEPSMIDGAVLAAEELKKQNDRKEELLKKEEELETKRILGGRSEAGQIPPKKEEISNADYATEVMKGNNPNE